MPQSLADIPNVAVYVVRHGVTQLNADNCFRGNANPDLATEGIRDATLLSKLFDPIDLSSIYCSDKRRAVHTAELIAKPHKAAIIQQPNLRALDVGDFSGKKRTPEAEEKLQYYVQNPGIKIPGGEALNDFRARVIPCLVDAVELYFEIGLPTMLVVHSSVCHEVGSWLYNDHKSTLVQPGGVVAIYLDGNGGLQAKPILKPVNAAPGDRAQTIS
jgi:broad specificity phosphatase PhoE